jgi:hypothetical protein
VGERRKRQTGLRNLPSLVGSRGTRRDESGCRYVQEQLTRGARRVQAYRIAPFVASLLVEKQRIQLVDVHKDGCRGKSGSAMVGSAVLCRSSCFVDPFLADVYRIPLSSPAAMAKEIVTRARSLESVQEGVEIRHLLVRRFSQHGLRYLITPI